MSIPPGVDLCTIAAGPVPEGEVSFENPETLGTEVVVVSVVLCAISTVLTAGRFYTNSKKLHSADWFTLAACVFNIGFTGIICSQHRTYRHSWDTPVCWFGPETLQIAFAQTILFSPVFFFAKAAIFLLYRQLFAINKGPRLAIDFGLLITLLTYLSNIPMAAVYMAPGVGETWEELLLTIAESSRPIAIAGIAQSAVGTLIDFYIFFLPLPFLLRLHLPSKRVMGLVGIFSTALLGVAASVVSLVFKIQILESTDTGWLAALTSLATLIEVNVAIIVGCMPAFASFATVTIGGSTLFKSLRSRVLGSRGQTAASKSGGSGSGRSGERPTPVVASDTDRQTSRRDTWYKLSDTTPITTHVVQTSRGDSHEEEHEMQSKPNSMYKETDQRV